MAEAGEDWIVGRKEIAKHLGLESEDTLDEWRKRYPNLPVYRVDGRLRALPSGLKAFIVWLDRISCPKDGSTCPRCPGVGVS